MILGLLVSACGFHLRGSEGYDLSHMTVIIEQSNDLDKNPDYRYFDKLVQRELQTAGAKVKPTEQLSNVGLNFIQIKVLKLDFSSQGISRDETGRANEHQITARVDYLMTKSMEGTAAESQEDRTAEILSLSATASYYQDYRNPNAGHVQLKQTEKILLDRLSVQLIGQIRFQSSH